MADRPDPCPACGVRVAPVSVPEGDGSVLECPACHDQFTEEDVADTVADLWTGD